MAKLLSVPHLPPLPSVCNICWAALPAVWLLLCLPRAGLNLFTAATWMFKYCCCLLSLCRSGVDKYGACYWLCSISCAESQPAANVINWLLHCCCHSDLPVQDWSCSQICCSLTT
jgi:hypothetical protein